jgi:glyoxylase-like metal-dependent hydrolase (beta-lactamase superfamily II)
MYLIYSGNEAAVIDPSMKYEVAAAQIAENDLKVKYIILTHAHFDHMLEINDWVEKTNATVIIGLFDSSGLSDSKLNCYWQFFHKEKGYFGQFESVDDGDALLLGNESIKVISTPGHTRGSISLLTDKEIFVGDVIFAGGNFGRCDLPGGDMYTLALTVERLCQLNGKLTVYSGHGEQTTIEEYKLNRRI